MLDDKQREIFKRNVDIFCLDKFCTSCTSSTSFVKVDDSQAKAQTENILEAKEEAKRRVVGRQTLSASGVNFIIKYAEDPVLNIFNGAPNQVGNNFGGKYTQQICYGKDSGGLMVP